MKYTLPVFFILISCSHPHIIQRPYQEDQVGIVSVDVTSRSNKREGELRQEALKLIAQYCPDHVLIKEYYHNSGSSSFITTQNGGGYISTAGGSSTYLRIEFKCKNFNP